MEDGPTSREWKRPAGAEARWSVKGKQFQDFAVTDGWTRSEERKYGVLRIKGKVTYR
jgi:hypothetical protein